MLPVGALGNEEGGGLECEVFQMAGNGRIDLNSMDTWRKSTCSSTIKREKVLDVRGSWKVY